MIHLENTAPESNSPENGRMGQTTVGVRWRPKYHQDKLPPYPLLRRMIHNNCIHRENTFKFLLMTYNILAQSLIRNDHFPHAKKENLKLKHRTLQIGREICEMHKPDVACLQEVDRFDLLQLKFQSHNYEFALLNKDVIKGSRLDKDRGGHGVLTMWNRSKFVLKRRMDVYFDQEIEFDGVIKPPACETGNVCVILALERVDCPGKGIIVSNHHLYWKPKAKEERMRQSWVLSQKIKEMVKEFSWQVFLCGDWNTLPSDELYQTLINGNDLLDSKLPWKQCTSAMEPEFTTSVGSRENWWGATVDYILHAVIDQDESVQFTSHLEMPNSDLIRATGIPNDFWPSDHVALQVRVEISEQSTSFTHQ